MYSKFQEHLRKELQGIREAGLYKEERVIVTPQGSDIEVANQNGDVLNFCANNYLGLADNSRLIEAAKRSWKKPSAAISRQKTQYSMPPASMPTAVSLSLFSPRRMPLFPIHSTMPRSSTACAYARHSVSAIRMPTWRIWSVA